MRPSAGPRRAPRLARPARVLAPLAALAVVLAVAVGVPAGGLPAALTGHAAQLGVGSAELATGVATRCTPDALALTPGGTGTTRTAVVTSVPAGCAGVAGRVVLLGASGPLTSPGTDFTLPATGSTHTITGVPAYDPQAVTGAAVVLDGWSVAAAWTAPPAAGPRVTCTTSDPARPCTADVVLRNGNVWSTGYDLDITVRDARTGSANNPVNWSVTLDFSHASYPWVPNAVEGSGVVATTTCAQLPVLTLTGRTDWGEHHLLRNGTTRTVWIQPRNDGVGSVLDCA